MKQTIIILLVSAFLTILFILGYDILVRTFGQPTLVRLPQLCIGESENDVVCLRNNQIRELLAMQAQQQDQEMIEPEPEMIEPQPQEPEPQEPIQEEVLVQNFM